ncbi:probable D-lactate dehydrogenase, mitochondrial isoform X2 [Ornithodoros turicata]
MFFPLLQRHLTRHLTSHRFLNNAVVDELSAIVGRSNASSSEIVRQEHSGDHSPYARTLPDIVVYPENTAQVSAVAKTCYKHGVPMVPYAYGAGLEGGVHAVNGGVCISFAHMNRIVDVHPIDFYVDVQPGATWRQVNAYIHDTGLWFPIDTGAECSIGGMCATTASSTNAILYGTMRENVLNLEVVLSDGQVIDTAGKKGRCNKSVSGYNLTNLFIGSEGTLGLITKATLRLRCLPLSIISTVCTFPSVTAAMTAVASLLRSNIPLARVDFMDEVSVRVCNHFIHKPVPEMPTLFIEIHGTTASTRCHVEAVKEIVHNNGASNFKWATDKEQRSLLWKSRNALHYATYRMRDTAQIIATDVCVPIGNLPELITETKEDFEANWIIGSALSHMADGTFHTTIMLDPENKEEAEKVGEVSARVWDRALKLDGSCSAEHGIGLGRRELLHRQMGNDALALMKSIKTALDPKNIMNPGKIFF